VPVCSGIAQFPCDSMAFLLVWDYQLPELQLFLDGQPNFQARVHEGFTEVTDTTDTTDHN